MRRERTAYNKPLEYVNRFTLLDNDTLVFFLSVIWHNDPAVSAINIVLKARGGTHNRNLLKISPKLSN